MNKVSKKIILQDVRGSYVYITKPRKKDDGTDGSYGIQVILPKDHFQAEKLRKLERLVLKEAFGEKAVKTLGKYKLPLRDGDDERDEEEYENMYFLNANGNRKPGIVNKHNEPADPDDLEEYCYSGAYFNVSINLYAFPSKDGGKPGVAVGLNNVMLKRKGDRLDGSTSATSDFADYAEDDDTDFDDDDDL